MRKFKTESKKLLDLMINSIYTNREIFLRELISNASDAEDKLYFRSLTDSSVQVGRDELAITLSFDADARTITVSDNGCGMTSEQLDANLGVIAHSDSQAFKAASAPEGERPAEEVEVDELSGGDVDIIGQFGVGFYSAFMVAKRVRVVSRAYGSDEAWAWESDGVEGYTLSAAGPDERPGHGTDVILTLKDDTAEEAYSSFLSEHALRDLVRRYSNYVRYPVQMMVTKSRQKPSPEGAPEDAQPEWENYQELETLNSMTPIWKRRRSEVSDEEYAEFYKGQFHDFADPQRVICTHAEGGLTYDMLLFIPSRPPFDLYSRDYQRGLQLYSSNVLIMDKCEELVPDHFNFVRGVVASPDLTLNISRETLQHNSQLRAIARKVERKIQSELEGMRDNARDDYEAFFGNFGRSLKYGVYQSYGMAKDTLGGLLLFYSAKQQKLVTLPEYVEAMAEGQEHIYYAAGESTERLSKMPKVTGVLARGFDVLLCTMDVDDFCMQAMGDFDGHALRNVAGGDLDLDTQTDAEAVRAATEQHADLLGAMTSALGDAVARVELTDVLGPEAAASLAAEGPVSLEMERVLAGMPGGENPKATRVLQVNAHHDVLGVLQAAQEAGDADKVEAYTKLLYNQALLMEGLPLEDPVAFAQAVTLLMK